MSSAGSEGLVNLAFARHPFIRHIHMTSAPFALYLCKECERVCSVSVVTCILYVHTYYTCLWSRRAHISCRLLNGVDGCTSDIIAFIRFPLLMVLLFGFRSFLNETSNQPAVLFVTGARVDSISRFRVTILINRFTYRFVLMMQLAIY